MRTEHLQRTIHRLPSVGLARLTSCFVWLRIRVITRVLNSRTVMTTRKQATPRKLPRQSRSVAMVDTILEASARVLKERGYEGMSTNAVAECAGVSVGSLYQYFPNKVALLAALHTRHADEMEDSIAAVLQLPAVGLRASITNLVRAVMAAHEVDPHLHRLLEKERPFFEEGGDRLGADIHKHVCHFLQRQGGTGQTFNLGLTAWVTMRMTESLVHSAILSPPTEHSPADVEQAIVNAIYAFLSSTLNGSAN
jgi:AcrR family transcriptional regulator